MGSKVQVELDARLLAGGYWFDSQEADRICGFFEALLRHSKGEWSGRLFVLEPWQRAFLRRLFGWRRPDGTRRYRRASLWIPRKNGKTQIAAGVGLYLTVADGEPGARVYCAATNEEQARECFDEACAMVAASPELNGILETFAESIFFQPRLSRFQLINAKPGSKHGLNVHGVIIDELHQFTNRDLYDVLTSASGARRQPLELTISTAGADVGSFAYEVYEYAKKVRDGLFEDPEFLPMIFEADPGDDWESEATWEKANPNLDVTIKRDYLRGEVRKAIGMPGRIAAFKQLFLNIWSQSAQAWLSIDDWRKCAGTAPNLEAYRGRKCWAGLDLSKTTDLTALVLVFKNPDLSYDVLPFFWCPADTAAKRAKQDRVQYPLWIERGFIRATEGNIVDYSVLRRDIVEISKVVQFQEIAYDRKFAGELVVNLRDQDGLSMVEFGQGFLDMSTPSQELERLHLGHRLRHPGNPVLDWMASNVVVRKDPAGNIKPDKEKSRERIDGIVALVMALGRASVSNVKPSVYETRGVIKL